MHGLYITNYTHLWTQFLESQGYHITTKKERKNIFVTICWILMKLDECEVTENVSAKHKA